MHCKIKTQFDVYVEDKLSDEDQLILVKFPSMESKFREQNHDLIDLTVEPRTMKLKLTVDKNSYNSMNHDVVDDQLYVCNAVNNKLVCRPISHIVTMRADLSHFDLKEEADLKEEVRPVLVKLATDRHGGPLRGQQDSKDEVEEFHPFRYRDRDSGESSASRIDLFCGIKQERTVSQFQADTKPDIKPKLEKIQVDDASKRQLSPKKSAAVRKLIKECLIKAKLLSFDEICNFIEESGETVGRKEVIDGLNESAVLVQGTWVVKSEILYGDSGVCEGTAVTGISINLFTAARDYLLWLFNQDRLVSRIEFSSRAKIPDYDILELFNQVATFRKETKKWEFKLATDQKFIEQFPEVVQRQQTFWKVRRANKLSTFK